MLPVKPVKVLTQNLRKNNQTDCSSWFVKVVDLPDPFHQSKLGSKLISGEEKGCEPAVVLSTIQREAAHSNDIYIKRNVLYTSTSSSTLFPVYIVKFLIKKIPKIIYACSACSKIFKNAGHQLRTLTSDDIQALKVLEALVLSVLASRKNLVMTALVESFSNELTKLLSTFLL